MDSQKDIDAINRKLAKRGWKIIKTDRHTRLYPPDGGKYIVCPVSTSDARAVKKHISVLRRHGVDI